MTRSLASNKRRADHDVHLRTSLIRVVGTIVALAAVVVPLTGLAPALQYGDSYLEIILSAAVAAGVLAGSWGIFIHGDLKQRSDCAVALTTAFVLLALAGLAHSIYGSDWVWSKTCANADALHFFPECSDAAKVFRYNLNAATLDQIYGVLAVGQIIPMLSIFKDAVYCWLRPTPWYDVHKDNPESRSIRRANLRRSSITNG